MLSLAHDAFDHVALRPERTISNRQRIWGTIALRLDLSSLFSGSRIVNSDKNEITWDYGRSTYSSKAALKVNILPPWLSNNNSNNDDIGQFVTFWIRTIEWTWQIWRWSWRQISCRRRKMIKTVNRPSGLTERNPKCWRSGPTSLHSFSTWPKSNFVARLTRAWWIE